MNPLHALFLVLVGMGAGFVQRVSGFGLGIFAMMFLPHFMPSHTAAATISSIFSFVTSLYNAVRYRKDVSYKTAFPMICAAFVSIPIAVHYAVLVKARIFEILLGAVLILLSVYFLFFSKRVSIRPTVTNGILAGTLGGALNGLFSTGGPPIVLYLTNATADNATYFATIQFYFCFTNLYATATRAASGIITADILLYSAVGIVGCMAGDLVGKRVFDRLDSRKMKYVIYIAMIISGMLMLL
ncbi:MAG: sulfite exporter TauE/SafE family protein [Clostridia bacterium]|nr:sulfite exporter TauE/SafE family protein [Clostridia bacterium]